MALEQFERIKDCLPRQRGNVRIDNLTLLNALLYVLENGGKWRRLPREYGPWHTVYMRLYRWSKAGVMASSSEQDISSSPEALVKLI